MGTILYREDGSKEFITPKNSRNFSLFEMQQLVGGLIQILPLGENRVMVCNDEGKINGISVPNWNATDEWVKEYGPTDVIYGNALVCDSVLIK